MAITLGDAFQNWNPDTKLATGGAKVDGGVIAMLEPNIFRNKVMLPGVTFATDVESLMVDNRFAVAFIRKLDKVKVTLTKATADGAFRVVPTQSDGDFIEVKCNDVLKVAEVVNEPIDEARVSGRTAERVALASESYDEIKELRYLSYLINGGGSPDATDVGAPASANTTRCTKDTVLDNIIDDRATLRKAGADPDTLIISEDTDAVFLKYNRLRRHGRRMARNRRNTYQNNRHVEEIQTARKARQRRSLYCRCTVRSRRNRQRHTRGQNELSDEQQRFPRPFIEDESRKQYSVYLRNAVHWNGVEQE